MTDRPNAIIEAQEDGPPSFRFRRPSTGDALANLLRTRLIAGQFMPGQPMRESTLARDLGVSRPTVREALQQLVREGLLTYHLHKGMVVKSLTESDIVDTYRVRALVEAAGMRALGGRREPLEALDESLAASEQAVAAGDALGAVDADMALHNGFAALTGNRRLVQLHRTVFAELRLALSRMDLATGDALKQIEEHTRLVRHLQAGDTAAALKLLDAHLESARVRLSEFISGSE